MPLRIHLDTDIGGDTDDLCALALLLASPEVDIAGITTCADPHGKRLSFVRHALRLAGREDVPSASGAYAFLGGMPHTPQPQDQRYWPDMEVVPPTPPGAALDLLQSNVASGAAVVAIGPFTNLAIFEAMRPGVFATTRVVVMGGHTGMPDPGLPQWPPAMDYNVQADRVAAEIVFNRVHPLIVPLPTTRKVCLRGADLPSLRAGGPLAQLLALQGDLHGRDYGMERLAPTNHAVPEDILNFQYDSVAVAAALGWDCLTVEDIPLAVRMAGENIALERTPGAPLLRVATDVDAEAFRARWLETVTRI